MNDVAEVPTTPSEAVQEKKVLIFNTEAEYINASRESTDAADVIIVEGVMKKNRQPDFTPSTDAATSVPEVEHILSVAELFVRINQWGKDRNIIGGATSQAQFVKLIEEFGEVVDGVVASNRNEIKDGLGDTLVVLTLIAGIEDIPISEYIAPENFEAPLFNDLAFKLMSTFALLAGGIARANEAVIAAQLSNLVVGITKLTMGCGFTVQEVLTFAYNNIKDRKGVVLNGVFIKSTDPQYANALALLGKTE